MRDHIDRFATLLPAGTWMYWQAWLLIGLLFFPITCIGIWLLIASPELLAKRLNNKEKEDTQKHVVALSGLMFVGGFVVCGLDKVRNTPLDGDSSSYIIPLGICPIRRSDARKRLSFTNNRSTRKSRTYPNWCVRHCTSSNV